jgi:hypothetical protein
LAQQQAENKRLSNLLAQADASQLSPAKPEDCRVHLTGNSFHET